jgi:hypothetical protein
MRYRSWLAGVCVATAACGDSGGGTASAGATETTLPPGTSSSGEAPTTGGGEAEATATTGMGGSMTQATTGEPPTTGVVTSSATSTGEPDTTSTSSSGETGTSESGGPGVCAAPEPGPGAVPIDPSCTIVEMVGSWTPVIEWQDVSLGVTYTTPAIANCTDDNGDGVIDGDDIPDIAVATSSGVVHLLSRDGAGKHWTAPQNMGGEPSSATIADLDGDQRPEVVVSGPTGFYAWHCDTGALYWQNAMGGSPTICGGNSVYDVDGDGMPEVVQGHRIFNGQTGALRGAGMFGHGTGYGGDLINFGVVADLDQDGVQEVLVGNAGYDADGNTLWQNGQSDGYVAVGDFDDDAFGEMIVATSPGNVRLQDHDGTVIWTVNIGGGTIGPPTIADFDGDGEPEAGVSGTNRYAVIDGDGAVIWQKVIADGSGFTGSSVFDFEGDGKAEVVYADEQNLWVYDGATGDVKLQEMTHSSATCSEYPSIADVDNDGHAEIVSSNDQGVTVIGDMNNSWRRSRTTWNQHSYHITNVEGPAGEIPTAQETNWLTFNNFRSASTGGSAGDAVPVLVEVCTSECPLVIKLAFQIGNGGTADLPAGVHASVYGLQNMSWVFLGSVITDAPIAAGSTSPTFAFDVDPADVIDGSLRVVVDDENGVDLIDECHEDNNTAEVSEGLCTLMPPG